MSNLTPTDTAWNADPDLSWHATKIGHGSSHVPGADEWSDVTIHRTARGTYVITGTRYYDNGDRTFEWINVQRSARNVLKALSRVDRTTRERFLPQGAETAVENAAEHDPAIAVALEAFDAGE